MSLTLIHQQLYSVLRHFQYFAVVYICDCYGSVFIVHNGPSLIVVAKIRIKLKFILACVKIKRLASRSADPNRSLARPR